MAIDYSFPMAEASCALAAELFLQLADAGFGSGAGLPFIRQGSDGPSRARIVKAQFAPLPTQVQVQRFAVALQAPVREFLNVYGNVHPSTSRSPASRAP